MIVPVWISHFYQSISHPNQLSRGFLAEFAIKIKIEMKFSLNTVALTPAESSSKNGYLYEFNRTMTNGLKYFQCKWYLLLES